VRELRATDHAPPIPGGGLDELWLKLFGHPEGHIFAKPEESPAARPSSSSPPSGPAGGSTDVEKPLPSIPEEPSPVSSLDHAPPSRGDGLEELWLKLFGNYESHFLAKPEESPAARPSSSSPLPSIPEEPLPVSSPDHAPPSPG
jgi:hypothetical protein